MIDCNFGQTFLTVIIQADIDIVLPDSGREAVNVTFDNNVAYVQSGECKFSYLLLL